MKFSCVRLLFFLLLCLPVFGCATVSDRPGVPDVHASRYDDAGIKTTIGSTLLKQDASRANDINVHCFNGHVVLVGEADNDFRAVAEDISRRTEGVVKVTPHWFPSGTASTLKDAEIEAEIDMKRLFAEKKAAPFVALDVWGGHVVLSGLVSEQTVIDQAKSTIKKVPHVKSVTSYLELSR